METKKLTEAELRQRRERLAAWKDKVSKDEAAWDALREKMEQREQLYDGSHKVDPVTKADKKSGTMDTYCVRNVIQENIETMVDSHIPAPKVTPLRKEDEGLARKLEGLLRFTVMRRHLRVMNDLAERISYIQGGVAYLVEWNNARRTPDGYGDVDITLLHPKQIVPQDGIYTDIQDMDHITVRLTMTKNDVLRRFGVDVSSEREADPGLKGKDGSAATVEDLVTLYVVYYRDDRSDIGMFAWVDNTVVADFPDYQARRMRRCKLCGAIDSYAPGWDEVHNEDELLATGEKKEKVHRCAYCESTEFEDAIVDEEIIMKPTVLMGANAQEIRLEPARAWQDENQQIHFEPVSTIPYYRPDLLPVVLQKNVSKFGNLLGESDVDRMADAQNAIKRLDQKLLDRLAKAGTKISLPPDTHIETTTEDQEVIRPSKISDMEMIKTFEFSGNISPIMNASEKFYEQARQVTGITDSMQGRRDPTATSARAKEFSANKSEGRMESKRVMKREAWAKIYEMIAKIFLANADVPQHLRAEKPGGGMEYQSFDRHDFLKQGADGKVYYETGFVFDCDDATLLGDSREAMWRELKEAFAAGTLGSPQEIDTRILYWSLLEEQGYPGAAAVKQKMEEQRDAAAKQMATMPPQAPGGGTGGDAATVTRLA